MQTKPNVKTYEGQTFIIGYVGDKQGCGFYRFRSLATYLNNVENCKYRFLEPPFEINDERV